MEIKRDLYLKQLIDRKQNGLIKVITGIRRCGKSYLLNTLFYNYLKNSGVDDSHIIKFAFDSNIDLNKIGENIITLEKERRKVDPTKLVGYIQSKMKDEGMYYLLLDEVQFLDCFESVLNSYLQSMSMLQEATQNFYQRMSLQSLQDVVMKFICSLLVLRNSCPSTKATSMMD